jgi:transposase
MGVDHGSPHDWKEWRRLRAWQLKGQGWIQQDIADALGVSKGAVSRWLETARREGPQALLSHPAPGPTPLLTPAQKRLIPDFLWHGAEAYGFRGDVWTCARLAQALEEEFGVRYHKGHVARLLRELGGTPQVPLRRAFQRDEEAITRWQAVVWPAGWRRACREQRALVFVDEAGFYLLPGVVKTYGPRGRRPVVSEWQTKDHLSVRGGMTPHGKFYTLVRQEPLNGLHTIEFLGHLLRQTERDVLVVWDGSPIHRRKEVKEFLARGLGRQIHLEPLPPYAPDLNPQEWVWQHLKHVEMRNLACLDLEELHEQFHLALARVRQKKHLAPSFFAGAGLEF